MRTIELFDAPPVAGKNFFAPAVSLADYLCARTRRPVEASASNLGNIRNLLEHADHPFIEAVRLAYAHHWPLVLSPDDIWLAIISAFALHVNVNAEALRDCIVSHRGRALISLERDALASTSTELFWYDLFAEFGARITEHVGSLADVLTADFSTTTAVEKGVSQIVLMSAMQPYLRYEVTVICGIPRITLLGTPDDWKSIRRRAALLAEYDLKEWAAGLLPVLDELVSASEGIIDEDFWRSIYVHSSEFCGSQRVSGWINAFFPYILSDSERAPYRLEVNLHALDWRGAATHRGSGPRDSQFPWALSRAPFVWKVGTQQSHMEFTGGFVGVSRDQESLAMRPVIGWAVQQTSPSTSPAVSKP